MTETLPWGIYLVVIDHESQAGRSIMNVYAVGALVGAFPVGFQKVFPPVID